MKLHYIQSNEVQGWGQFLSFSILVPFSNRFPILIPIPFESIPLPQSFIGIPLTELELWLIKRNGNDFEIELEF